MFFLLVLLRLSGAIIVNPIFGRKNVPGMVKAGLTLSLALALTVSTTAQQPQITSLLDFVIKGILEFAIGYSISLIMYLFLSAVIVAYDLIDIQIGIGLAKAFDPGSNFNASVTGAIFSSVTVLLFFVTNGHITVYRLLSDSVTAIPCGSDISLYKASYAISVVMCSTLSLALKMALPVVAIEFVSEMGLGILTRAVPNLNIFSIGIQLKLLVGLAVIFLLSPLFGIFSDQLFRMMYADISRILNLISAG